MTDIKERLRRELHMHREFRAHTNDLQPGEVELMLEAILARIEELEAIVERLPVMGNGERARPGMQHWILAGNEAICRARDISWRDFDEAGKDWSLVFPTREAAEAARATA